MLRQTDERAKLDAMLRACPQLLNAQILLGAINTKREPTYSVNGTANRLFAIHEQCEFNLPSLQTDSPDARKLHREITDQLAKLQPLCHPKFKLFARSLDALLDALRDVSRNDPKDTGARAKKARSALSDALANAASEAAGVEGEVGLGH
jgi:hypothetical protein